MSSVLSPQSWLASVGLEPQRPLLDGGFAVGHPVSCEELLAIVGEGAVQDGGTDLGHGARHEAQVVYAVEPVGQQLFGAVQVVQVAHAEVLAGVTVAARLYRVAGEGEALALDGHAAV